MTPSHNPEDVCVPQLGKTGKHSFLPVTSDLSVEESKHKGVN